MWWHRLSAAVTKGSSIFLQAVGCLAIFFLANQMLLNNLHQPYLLNTSNLEKSSVGKVRETNINNKSLEHIRDKKTEVPLESANKNKSCTHVNSNNNLNWLEKYHRRLLEGGMSTTKDCISWNDINIDVHPYQLKHDKQSGNKVSNEGGETPKQRKKSFSKIYKKNLWGKESKSGPGSLIKNAQNIIKVLTVLVERIKVVLKKETIKILDSSCGDMTWMPTFLKNRPDIEYTGYDIVKDNIDNHRGKFRKTGWKFEVHDLVTDHIPASFDLILSRQTTQHLKTADVRQILKNFGASNSSFLLTTNFLKNKKNKELNEKEQYRVRMINFHLEPFKFPPPACQSLDSGQDWITLWDISTLDI